MMKEKIKAFTEMVEALNDLISKVITFLGIIVINIAGLISIVQTLIATLFKK